MYSDMNQSSIKIQKAMERVRKREGEIENQEDLEHSNPLLTHLYKIFPYEDMKTGNYDFDDSNFTTYFDHESEDKGDNISWIIENYSNNYSLPDLFSEKSKEMLQKYFKKQKLFSFAKTRNLAVKVAVHEFRENPYYRIRFDAYVDKFKNVDPAFLDYCIDNKLNYPNFVLLEIERYLISHWYLIHPRNFISLLITFALRNIEKILFLDEILDTMRFRQETFSKQNPVYHDEKYELEYPELETQQIISEFTKRYWEILPNFVPDYEKKYKTEEIKKISDENRSLAKEVLVDFVSSHPNNKIFLNDIVNHIWKLEGDLYEDLPYQKTWDFITNCAKFGVNVNKLAMALLATASSKVISTVAPQFDLEKSGKVDGVISNFILR